MYICWGGGWLCLHIVLFTQKPIDCGLPHLGWGFCQGERGGAPPSPFRDVKSWKLMRSNVIPYLAHHWNVRVCTLNSWIFFACIVLYTLYRECTLCTGELYIVYRCSVDSPAVGLCVRHVLWSAVEYYVFHLVMFCGAIICRIARNLTLEELLLQLQ